MGPLFFLLACYVFILIYLVHHAREVCEIAWNHDRRRIKRKLLILLGVLFALLLNDYLVLNSNWEHAGWSFIVTLNISLAAVAITIVLGILAIRKVFTVIITFLYIFNLVQYHQFLNAITGESSQDSGVGYGLLFNIFINLVGFAVAIAIDHVVHLVKQAKA